MIENISRLSAIWTSNQSQTGTTRLFGSTVFFVKHRSIQGET